MVKWLSEVTSTLYIIIAGNYFKLFPTKAVEPKENIKQKLKTYSNIRDYINNKYNNNNNKFLPKKKLSKVIHIYIHI